MCLFKERQLASQYKRAAECLNFERREAFITAKDMSIEITFIHCV